MPYSSEIVNAWNDWNAAESKVPEKETAKGYSYRNRQATKKWKIFSDLCKSIDVLPMKAEAEIRGTATLNKINY